MYKQDDKQLDSSMCRKDLEVLGDHKLNVCEHCDAGVRTEKGNQDSKRLETKLYEELFEGDGYA